MKRRDSLKVLLASGGALLSLPSWAQNWNISEISQPASVFSETHQQLLSAVADTIILAGNSIGALTVGVDKFLIKLFDDCYTPEVQENLKSILTKLDSTAQSRFAQSFTSCNQQQREELLLQLSTSDSELERDAFKTFKSETIRGFSTSREVLTTYYKYKTVPGHYYGCVDVNQ